MKEQAKITLIRTGFVIAGLTACALFVPPLLPIAIKAWGAQGGITALLGASTSLVSLGYFAPELGNRIKTALIETASKATSFFSRLKQAINPARQLITQNKGLSLSTAAIIISGIAFGFAGIGIAFIVLCTAAGTHRFVKDGAIARQTKTVVQNADAQTPELYKKHRAFNKNFLSTEFAKQPKAPDNDNAGCAPLMGATP